MIVVTICVASFGLARFQQPTEKRLAESGGPVDPERLAGTENSPHPGLVRRQPAGPDPLSEHLDRLGRRIEELVDTVSEEHSTQTEIARLADSMQAVRQQTDLSDTKIQHELSSLRVNNEVELRDLNRQINTVSEKSKLLEREMIEQRAGILSALENQKSTIATQVARLEGSLDEVHTELSELRTNTRSTLASAPSTHLQSVGSLTSLTPVPKNHSGNHPETEQHDVAWKEPVVLDSSIGLRTNTSAIQQSTKTATSTGWKVSPMSHSTTQPSPQVELMAPELSLPPAPPSDAMPATLPPISESSRRTPSGIIRAPLRSTLAPTARAHPVKVPEILELPAPDMPAVRQISATTSSPDGCVAREYEVQTTVIHIAASRPVDVEPTGVRMLNPELTTTAYGLPWTHEAVAHELLRKISLRTEASIEGRQQAMITSGGTEKLSIGSSCPHCNEVHGFDAGDRLILSAGPACDKVQQFHVISEVSGGGAELDSMPQFDLTPITSQTYVICEEAVEGTIEETVATTGEKLVPIHGVLTPVSGPARTQVSTQLMQRVVVMTFRDVHASSNNKSATALADPDQKKIALPAPLALPAPEPARQVAVKKLTPVKRHPVFLPPPALPNARKTPRVKSDVEFVTTAPRVLSQPIRQAGHQQEDDECEICEQKHEQTVTQAVSTEASSDDKQSSSFFNWFRRVRSESTDEESEVKTADFETSKSGVAVPKSASESRKTQRRFVTKPGNRRQIR